MAAAKIPTTETVLAALDEAPATTAEVAAATGLGRSTVGKALAALETNSRAIRTTGGRDGGRKQPDRWTLATTVETAGNATATATTADADADDRPAGSGSGDRLGKGQLRTLVLDHLKARPGEERSPTQVAKALGGRSSGAVGNALLKLAAEGAVTQTSAKPRRFAATS